jgi:hypothetical protein
MGSSVSETQGAGTAASSESEIGFVWSRGLSGLATSREHQHGDDEAD